MDLNINDIEIINIVKKYEKEAKKVIVDGLKEYFEEYDESLNSDLKNIYETYNKDNHFFILGVYNNKVVATSGLIKENENTGRIVRMSVKKEFRQKGVASLMIRKIEKIAKNNNCEKLLLETTKTWEKAIKLYRKNNYKIYKKDERNIYFIKKI